MNIKKILNVDYDLEITGINIDSRLVKPGDLFVCIKGYTVDGHQFAKKAEAAGAVAIVCEHLIDDVQIPQIVVESTQIELPRLAHMAFNQPTEKLNLYGVTGTNGKTTVAYMMEHLFKSFSSHTAYIGTNGIRYADYEIEPINTTPEPLSLQKTFADMVIENVENVAIEVSSHALDLCRVDYCAFKVAVFTNLTPEHLEFHPTMEDYFQAKYKLFTQIVPNGYAIINIDDEYGVRIVELLKEKDVNVLTYAVEKEADFQAQDIQMTISGTKFTLKSPKGDFEVHAPILGLFNVYNVLATMAAMYTSEMPLEKMIESIQHLPGVDGRMELINEGQDFTVIVDFAHTPDGVEKVLEFVSSIKQNKIRFLIGCPGDRDRTKRPVMARLAVDYADDAIFTTDDPHSEDPVAILDEMVAELADEQYEVIVDRADAIEAVINRAQANDIVVIAGRGHEKLQYWKDYNIVLDDREVAKEVLRKKLSDIKKQIQYAPEA